MALHVKEQAHEIEREVTVKAGIPGYPDRVFVIAVRADWIEVREKGKTTFRKMRWDSWIRWVFMHCPECGK